MRSYDVGQAALCEWLAEPVKEHFELRDIAEIKLFFNELAGPEDVARLAQDQVEQHRRLLGVADASSTSSSRDVGLGVRAGAGVGDDKLPGVAEPPPL
ncbi:hypothetical protein ACFYOY_48670 [Streptomyces sp. NPDC007875]|uniref:hypothetical protein n=1 Tax=Streptomyces sp. NPDC007875 TaxID=3364783 RepID=UPI0036BA6515